MTTFDNAAASSDRTVPRLHGFARGPVLTVAAVVGAAQFAASFVDGYWFDEVYMLAIGRYHLDWGSADQPPLTPLLAALMDWIAPGSNVALRLPAVLATAAAVVVAALIARELGGDRRAQTLTAGVQATTLWITLAGHWLTPYTLEPVQWLLLCWLLARWLRRRDDRLLLAVGVLAGIAAQTKFQVLLLCAVLLLAVLVCGPRELLRRPLLWAAAGIGALIALPTLLWQAANGWPQLEMTSVVIDEAEALGGRGGVAVLLIASAGLAGIVLILYGLWRLLHADELRAHRFLVVASLALYVLFVAAPGRPYYLGGLYGLLAAAGALGLQRRREAGRQTWRWVAWPAYALSAAAAAGMLLLSALSVTSTSAEIGEEIAQGTAAAYHALPPEVRDDTIIMGGSYITAAYIDGYSRRYDLPQAYSSSRGYGWFPPPPQGKNTVLYVGADPAELRPHCTDVRKLLEMDTTTEAAPPGGAPDTNGWLCTGVRQSWASLWPKLRNLSVR